MKKITQGIIDLSFLLSQNHMYYECPHNYSFDLRNFLAGI